MGVPYVYVSFVTRTATDPGARNFSYIQVLNTDWTTGWTSSGGSTSAVPASYFSNANNVSWGTAGTVVTASASYTWAHVAPARGDAWEELGVWVSSASATDPVEYSQWVAGSSGHWGWIQLP